MYKVATLQHRIATMDHRKNKTESRVLASLTWFRGDDLEDVRY
jgi:hypothetical protein